MIRLFPAACLGLSALALSGCDLQIPGTATAEAPEYPAEVIAALPAGVPPSIVFQTADGCYAYAIEVTEPMQGFRLRDRNGNIVCDPGKTPAPTPAEAAAT